MFRSLPFSKTITRLKHGILASAFVASQLVVPMGALGLFTGHAAAAATLDSCTIDVQGANDVPGQKDLTQFCKYTGDAPGQVTVSWQWDDTAWSGSNTGDACALFDTNGDNKIDAAVCVSVETKKNKPTTQVSGSPIVYTCNNSDVDNCKNATLVSPTTTTCAVTSVADTAFATDDSQPNDTQAKCTITLADVGNGTLKDVCSYPSASTPSDPSDCVITPTTHVPTATINVVKSLVPTNDSGTFTVSISGVNASATGGNGTQTGATDVTPGTTYTVGEAGANGTALDNYSTNVACYNGNTLLPNSGSRTGDLSRTISVTPTDGDSIVCTFTNTRLTGSVRVVKDVINDNGGTKTAANNFTFQNNLGGAQTFTATAGHPSPDGERLLSLPVGTPFSITEDQANSGGYTTAYSGTCTGTVTATEQVCTITNNDQPGTLNVNKVVVNDNGGTKQAQDFQFQIGSGSATNFESDGSNSVTVNAGTYSISEVADSGYAATYDNCTNVVVANGGSATCTITNNDIAPLITVTKTVINNDGGKLVVSNFPLSVGNLQVTSGAQTSINAGTYLVSEIGNSGYQASTWGGDCDSLGNITLAVGGVYACTITNDDIPAQITVTKQVTNDNNGTAKPGDFDLYVGTSKVVTGVTNTFSANTSYTVSEKNGPSGYTQTSLTCEDTVTHASLGATFTPALNQKIACAIVNNDIAPTLTLLKHVTNDNGGLASTANFQGKIDGTDVAWGTPVTLNAGTHTVSEGVLTGGEGYAASGWSTDCASNGSVTLAVGQNLTCTITNDDISPQLTVIKHVINDNSGKSSASDFTMNVTGTNASSSAFAGSEAGKTITLNQGSYSVSEGDHAGYTVSYSDDCTGSVTLDHTKICTVTNNDIPHPGINVVKSGPATAHEGDTVTYTFTVTNTGDTPLGSLTVSDNVVGNGIYQSGDTNNNGKLDTSETWIYSKNYVISIPQVANVDNTVTACGDDTDQANPQGQTCDTDNHTLDVLHPTITVVKSGPIYGYEGQTIGYTFVVTNTGDTPLTNVGINDDIAIGEKCDDTTLAVGAHTDCTAMYLIPTPTTGDVTNHVVASGTDSLNKTVTSNDQHTLTVIHPAIHVVKSGPATAHEGDTVTYTFTVTNTGDIALSGVTVTDNIAGNATYVSGDTNTNSKLDLSETWVFTKNYVIPTSQTDDVVNTATACGNDPLSNSTCDTDIHTLDVLHPGIHVVKSGPSNAYVGDTVTYTFTVTNTGDTPLDITTVNDNVVGDGTYQSGDTNNNGLLDTTETWVYSKNYTIPANLNDITNTVTVCADDSLQLEKCDTDEHTTHVYHPTISVTKYVWTDAASDDGSFNLKIDGHTYATGGDGTVTGDIEVAHGTHTVSETGANGTDLSDYDSAIACYVGEVYIGTSQDNPSGLGTSLDDVAVNGDQHAHCNIYNVRHAHLTVVKDAVPNDPQQFNFTLERQNDCYVLEVSAFTEGLNNQDCDTLSSVDSFQLVDNTNPALASKTESLSAADIWSEEDGMTYRVTEAATDGWDLTGLNCGDVQVSYDGAAATLVLHPGDNVTCTYTNTKRASLTIKKDAQPNSLQMFNFTSDIDGANSFSLMDDGTANTNSKTMTNLLPGTYTVTEAASDNWSLNGVSCGDGVTMKLDGHTLTVTLAPGANVTCTFTNAQGAVLGAVTTPLVNTGNSIWVNVLVGLTALFTTLGLAVATRRSAKA